MRQRAMIAIALAAEPTLLLADEPTTALDVTIQDQILKLLLRLTDELGMAMILVTHDLGVVAETCDRVARDVCGPHRRDRPGRGHLRRIRATPTPTRCCARCRSGGPAREPLAPIPGQPPRLDRAIAGCPFAPRCAFVEERCTHHRPRPAPRSAPSTGRPAGPPTGSRPWRRSHEGDTIMSAAALPVSASAPLLEVTG